MIARKATRASRTIIGTHPIAILWVMLLLAQTQGLHAAPDARLNVFIWSEYLDPRIVREFEQATRSRVVLDVYEDAEAMLAKVQTGGGYDVVVPPDYLVPTMLQQKLLAPLSTNQIPNLRQLDPKFANPSYDPGGRHTAAFQWGTLGIYLRKPKGATPEPSWNLIFDTRHNWGPISLIDSMRDLIGAALKYRGQSLNATSLHSLKEARDLILATKQRAVGFDGSVAGRNKVLAKTAAIAMVYSGEGVRGMAEDPATVYLHPKEGSQIWVDNLVILARAPHKALAEQFINFLLAPPIAARVSVYCRSATPVLAARPLLPPEVLANPGIYPPPEVMSRLELLQDLGQNSKLYDELWTQIKSR